MPCCQSAGSLPKLKKSQKPKSDLMANSKDIAPLWWDPIVAAILLTRLPMPKAPERAFAQQARAVWAFPLVGLFLGICATLIGWLGPTPMLSAVLSLAALAVMTGALHEDGLADTADGLWGGHTAAQRLDIMKDSRIGAYGVLALIFVSFARLSAVVAAGPLTLIASATLSRALIPPLMLWLPPARPDGLAQSVGKPPTGSVLAGIGLGLVLSLVLVGPPALWAALVAGLVTALLARIARSKIGGQSGDILGAAQQLSEVAILIALIP